MRLSRRERMRALSQFGKNFETSSGARDSHEEIVPHCCGPMLSTLRTVSRPKRFQVGQRGSLHDVIYRPLGVGVCDSSRAGVQPNTTFLPNYRAALTRSESTRLYEEKAQLAKGVDPSQKPLREWADNIDKWPAITGTYSISLAVPGPTVDVPVIAGHLSMSSAHTRNGFCEGLTPFGSCSFSSCRRVIPVLVRAAL